jgi:hypothetical protein
MGARHEGQFSDRERKSEGTTLNGSAPRPSSAVPNKFEIVPAFLGEELAKQQYGRRKTPSGETHMNSLAAAQ